MTAYWLTAGTALLDTVGGARERRARSRSASALAIAVLVLMAKVAAGAFAVVHTHRPSRRLGTLAAVAGALLAIYGGVLTVAGAVVRTGAASTSPTDERALRWHTLLWDPWVLTWGVALAVAGISAGRSRRGRSPRTSVQ